MTEPLGLTESLQVWVHVLAFVRWCISDFLKVCLHVSLFVYKCVVLGYWGRWTYATLGTGSPWLALTRIADHINAATHLSLPPSSFSLSLLPSALSTFSARHHKPTAEHWDTPDHWEGQAGGCHALRSLLYIQPHNITFFKQTHMVKHAVDSARTRTHTHRGNLLPYDRVHITNIYTPKHTQKAQWKVKHYTGANIHYFTKTHFLSVSRKISLHRKEFEVGDQR